MNLSSNFYRRLNTSSDTMFDLVIPENENFLLNVTIGKLRLGWMVSAIKVCENVRLIIPEIPKQYSSSRLTALSSYLIGLAYILQLLYL